jgi:hypothetical protein
MYEWWPKWFFSTVQVAKGRVIRKLRLDASQGVRTAAAGSYSFASPPVADERDLNAEVRLLEAQRTVQRIGKI